MKTRIAISTLGCKINQSESAGIISQFDPDSIELVDFEQDADIYIVNTCTVTNRTDYKSRNLIRKALEHKNKHHNVKVIVTGCYSQRSREEVLELGDIDLVVDNQNKIAIKELIEDSNYVFKDIMEADEFAFHLQSSMSDHSRAFQKIQDGCDYYCSYCAVPYARGHIRSAKLKDVITQAELFVANGYREIVLGGVNLALYRDGKNDLAEVVKALSDINGLEILRLSSLEPQLLSERLLEAVKSSPILAPHFHIAIQSGCDAVLNRMKRVYDTALLRDKFAQLISIFPDAAIGGDVIVGFPGETSEDYKQTLNFLDSSPLTYLHVFAYSKRKGTPAAAMPQQIVGEVKKERSRALMQLSDAKKNEYISSLIINKTPIRGVVESIDQGIATFLSDHYIRAFTTTPCQQGQVISIIPSQPHLDGVMG